MKKIMNVVLLVLCVILCAGIKLVFHACEVGENIMACHWAEQAVFAFGIVLVVQSLGLMFFREAGVRKGICFSIIPIAVITALIPGVFIHLCMMNDMRCHTVMRPAVIILTVLIVMCAIVNIVLESSDENRK